MISSILLSLLAVSASVNAHGVILKVQGENGSPDGVGFQGMLIDRVLEHITNMSSR